MAVERSCTVHLVHVKVPRLVKINPESYAILRPSLSTVQFQGLNTSIQLSLFSRALFRSDSVLVAEAYSFGYLGDSLLPVYQMNYAANCQPIERSQRAAAVGPRRILIRACATPLSLS